MLCEKKVDFIVAGAQKAGTTALDYYLRQHPDLSLPKVKEVHYFDDEREFSNKPDYSNYHAFFSDWGTIKLHGEVTPIYMYWNESMRRICDYNSKIKIIILLRNPVDRAYSHWNMESKKNKDPLPFQEALCAEKARCKEVFPLQHRVFSYVSRGYYSTQLENIWRYFDKKNVLIIKHEELKRTPSFALNKISHFLGISAFPSLQHKVINSGKYSSDMPTSARQFLVEKFQSEIITIEKMLGWNCEHWKR